jgi:hypothetical protein
MWKSKEAKCLDTLFIIGIVKTEKSAVAAHIWKEKHAMDRKPVLLKQTSNKQELTDWENILVTKNKHSVINFESCHQII